MYCFHSELASTSSWSQIKWTRGVMHHHAENFILYFLAVWSQWRHTVFTFLRGKVNWHWKNTTTQKVGIWRNIWGGLKVPLWIFHKFFTLWIFGAVMVVLNTRGVLANKVNSCKTSHSYKERLIEMQFLHNWDSVFWKVNSSPLTEMKVFPPVSHSKMVAQHSRLKITAAFRNNLFCFLF